MLGKNRAREKVDELLSAYIDGALSPRERARLEARLAQDADLRARLESLQQTVALVRGMPPVRAPRNFLLTPAMARQPAPVARRLAPALTFATAISGLLCVILLVGNLITAGPGGMGTAAPAPMVAVHKESPQVMETGETDAQKVPPASETASPEDGPLFRAATASEIPTPEVWDWAETPSLIEGEPVGGGGSGGGGGASPGPSLWEPTEPDEEEGFLTLTPEMTPSEMARVATVEETPPAITVAEPTPVPVPPEMPGGKPPLPPTSWLPVGGLALLTAVLAIFSLRAWRAR